MIQKIPGLKRMKIDHAWRECPACGHGYKVEFYVKPSRMPPLIHRCKYCDSVTAWEEGKFYEPQVPSYDSP